MKFIVIFNQTKNRKLHSTVSGSKATDGNRTRDLLTTNEVRYLLCHSSRTD